MSSDQFFLDEASLATAAEAAVKPNHVRQRDDDSTFVVFLDPRAEPGL